MSQIDSDIRDTTRIRPMSEADSDRVAQIINQYATVEVLLWRTGSDIRRHLRGFIVAEWRKKIVGCAAIRDYGNGLYELRSLAVAPEFSGHGIGTKLVAGCLDKARADGGTRVFCLTRRSLFFERVGFTFAEKDLFPQKVWTDCQICWKRHRCDETAMLLDL